MAIHSSILSWRIPWKEEPGGLQSIGWQRVRHGWSDLTHSRLNTPKFHLSLSELPPFRIIKNNCVSWKLVKECFETNQIIALDILQEHPMAPSNVSWFLKFVMLNKLIKVLWENKQTVVYTYMPLNSTQHLLWRDEFINYHIVFWGHINIGQNHNKVFVESSCSVITSPLIKNWERGRCLEPPGQTQPAPLLWTSGF